MDQKENSLPLSNIYAQYKVTSLPINQNNNTSKDFGDDHMKGGMTKDLGSVTNTNA